MIVPGWFSGLMRFGLPVLIGSLGACGSVGDAGREAPVLGLDTARVIQNERLWRVGSVRFIGDRVLVANGGSRELFVFDPEGELELSFGRSGQGPGEFGYIADVFVRGDSVYVLDSLWKRLSLFVRGELVEDWRLREVPGIVERVAVRADGTPIIAARNRSSGGQPPGPSFERDSIRFIAITAGGESQWAELFAIPGVESMTTFLEGGVPYQTLPSFRANTSYDMTEMGVVTVEHRSGHIAAWSWLGDSVTIVGALSKRTYVSEDELAQWRLAVDDRASAVRGPEADLYRAIARAGIDRWGGRIPRPVYEDLKSDGGVVAVQAYAFGSTHPGAWSLFDSAGVLQGRFETPANMTVLRLRGDRIGAVVRDSLDVESIVVLKVETRH
jgi:hypothetical protein